MLCAVPFSVLVSQEAVVSVVLDDAREFTGVHQIGLKGFAMADLPKVICA
jgi:hypothetical protein